VLLLGVETPLGQSVLKRLREKLPILKIAVPVHAYSPAIEIPPYLVPIGSDTQSAFKQVNTVVCCCASQLNLKQSAETAGCRFISAFGEYDDVVFQICSRKLRFEPKDWVTRYQTVSTFNFSFLWWLAYRALSFPSRSGNSKWEIAVTQNYILEFDTFFYAFMVWLLTLILHILARFMHRSSPVRGKSSWRFTGVVEVESIDHTFEARFDCVDDEALRPDLLVCHVLDALSADPNEFGGWSLFDGVIMHVQLQRQLSSHK
jgi:hypothetical protein